MFTCATHYQNAYVWILCQHLYVSIDGGPHTHAHGIAFVGPIQRHRGNWAIYFYKNLQPSKFACVIAGHR
jgi:hypothetical protein